MAAPRPATLAPDIHREIGLLMEAGSYLSESSEAVVSLLDQCDKLIKADPSLGYIEKCFVAQLCGDKEEALRLVRNAKRLSSSRWLQAADVEACTLVNLGWFFEAREMAATATDPTQGNFGSRYSLLISSGQLRLLAERYEELSKMGIKRPTDFPQAILDARDALAAADVSDASVAEILDVAGEVLRSRRLFYVNAHPEVDVVRLGGDRIVHLVFRLAQSAREVAQANWQLADLMAQRDKISPSVHVSFGVRSA